MNKALFVTSAVGIALIKNFEGLLLEAYQDVVGVWTIGYGHTHNVKPGQRITEQQAEQLLKEDLRLFEKGVNRLVAELNIELTQCQFDALISFAFNLGLGNLRKSTLCKKLYLMKQHDQKSILAVADEFLKWNKAGGKVLNGLVRRRQAERNLFLGMA